MKMEKITSETTRLKEMNTRMAEAHLTEEGERVTYEEARDMIKDPERFAQRIESGETEVLPGCVLSERTVELGDGHFVNVYDMSFDADEGIGFETVTSKAPLYQHRLFKEQSRKTEGDPLVTINGAFFFLQDADIDREPEEIAYNLNIKNGQVVGLPSADRAAVVIDHDGKMTGVDLPAQGTIAIGEQTLAWRGGEQVAHGKEAIEEIAESEVLLFNSACCTIRYQDPNDKKSLRELIVDMNKTPERAGYTDIVVKTSSEGLVVADVVAGGGTDFFAGDFVLQVPESLAQVAVGDPVDPKTIGEFDIDALSSAMTVGPMVHDFLDSDDHRVNHDESLGSFPPFAPDARYARSVMYEDQSGATHFVVFDGVPRSENMKGVTPKEVAEIIPQDANWAVFMDGGQSSRMTFAEAEDSDQVDVRGNKQYIRLHERYKSGQGQLESGAEDQYLWSRKGRPVPSAIVAARR